jgi:TolA-binding protein
LSNRNKKQATRNKQQETSNKKQETSNKKQETRNKKQETRNKKQETRNKKQETNNKQQATSNKQPATSNQQQATTTMDKKIRYIKNEPTLNGFEDDLIINSEDAILFDTIGDYMKGKSDLDDVMNDPEYQNTFSAVQDMVSYYNNNSARRENEKFIRNIFTVEHDDDLTNEINNIKLEINENKLNEITAEWVREWHEKKQSRGTVDSKTEERRNFITEAIESKVTETEPEQQTPEPEIITIEVPGKSKNRSLIIRYSSLAAAALIGVFFIIKTILPSSGTTGLFESNYKPFDAMSVVTRSINNTQSDYSNSIEKYKSGDYQTAALGFTGLLEKDPSSVSAQFFLGITQLALKNYDQASNLLSEVVNNSGEFGKEARWYLGLTYIEKGDKQKAAECFEYLARSQGFYSERSEKILRRLK